MKLPSPAQYVIVSAQDLCHCSANCIRSCKGFIAPFWKASVLGQMPVEPKPGKDFNLESNADGEAVVGFGNLSCSSQASMMESIVLICISVVLCICVRAASTICCGHPSATAAVAIFLMTCLPYFSLVLAVSL